MANMLTDVFDYEKKNITMIRDDTENTELVPNKEIC